MEQKLINSNDTNGEFSLLDVDEKTQEIIEKNDTSNLWTIWGLYGLYGDSMDLSWTKMDLSWSESTTSMYVCMLYNGLYMDIYGTFCKLGGSKICGLRP